MKKKTKASEIIGSVWFGVKTCFLASKFYFSMMLVILIFTTVIPLINLWLWKEILSVMVTL